MSTFIRMLQLVGIALLAVVIVNNVRSVAVAQNETSTIATYPAVYLGPDDDKTLVNDKTREKYKIGKVRTKNQLDEYLQQNPKTAVIYIHPRNFANMDATWLRAQYKKGVAIVAINVPINPLAKLLGQKIASAVVDGVEIPQDDLPVRQDQVLVSVFYSLFDAHSQEVNGWGWYSYYYQESEELPLLVNELLQNNGKK